MNYSHLQCLEEPLSISFNMISALILLAPCIPPYLHLSKHLFIKTLHSSQLCSLSNNQNIHSAFVFLWTIYYTAYKCLVSITVKRTSLQQLRDKGRSYGVCELFICFDISIFRSKTILWSWMDVQT